jgi:hypothetical protein
LQDDEPGMLHLKLTSTLTMALYPTLAAMELVAEFLRPYNARAQTPIHRVDGLS